MFGLFKKKKSPTIANLLLGLSDQDFIFEMANFTSKWPPDAQAMTVVAYQNLGAFMKVMARVDVEKPNQEIPSTIEEYILFIGRGMESLRDSADEIATRRIGYFFQAALLKRAEILWQRSPQCSDAMAKIWIAIADGCYCLPALIQTVVIWSDEEKIWFRHIQKEKEAIEYCLNQVAPKEIRQLTTVKEYAKVKDLWLWN